MYCICSLLLDDLTLIAVTCLEDLWIGALIGNISCKGLIEVLSNLIRLGQFKHRSDEKEGECCV